LNNEYNEEGTTANKNIADNGALVAIISGIPSAAIQIRWRKCLGSFYHLKKIK